MTRWDSSGGRLRQRAGYKMLGSTFGFDTHGREREEKQDWGEGYQIVMEARIKSLTKLWGKFWSENNQGWLTEGQLFVHYTLAKLVTHCGLLREGHDFRQGHSSANERFFQGLTARSCLHNTLLHRRGTYTIHVQVHYHVQVNN